MSLSTHVLDAVSGRPAVGLAVSWFFGSSVVTRTTDSDGRISDWGAGVEVGEHRLVFATREWFGDRPAFYPSVTVTFEVTDASAHHHVPLLLSPFAYSTYRGS
ncbi:hydroxyisourate hydrolase [Cryptosporangium phraense]|uniref:5-hydroxyisourate hydrolase n=1 Tax=Cryptosporangium phraense TaxID=2593070 RepID=A0A545AQF2_9ACTN|nr:hydroxyisourate hydrolase [Cryptosporangium phraense]TQS43549.1 hydroxyisourate hydrolase [Cryptosporangium phraense]